MFPIVKGENSNDDTRAEIRRKGANPRKSCRIFTRKGAHRGVYERRKSGHHTAEKRTCFWSRSRQELWRKGRTSGNVRHVVSVMADCDGDALVVEVIRTVPPAIWARIPAFAICFSGTRRCSGFHWRRCTRCWRAAMPSVPRAAIPPTCLKKGGKNLEKGG